MTWREDLRRVTMPDGRKLIGASFRGVPFFVEATQRDGGRRLVNNEFPLRDDNFVENLGRRARTYRVDGYVIGETYLADKNALLNALEADGVGELIDPYHGILRAECETYSCSERRTDGGMATFSMSFVEAPAQAPTPSIVVNTTSAVDTAATATATAAKAELVESVTIAGMPAFALESAETALRNAVEGLSSALSPIIDEPQELAAFAGKLELMSDEVASLVRAPAELFDAFHGAITGLATTFTNAPGPLLEALSKAYGVDLGPDIAPTTSTRETERANQLAYQGALRRIMALEAARVAPTVNYVSIEEALAAREQVTAMLEEQANGAGDTVYPAIVDLLAQVQRAIPGSTVFARVVTINRPTAIPALVLAYQLYGSVELEQDIIDRNGISHPGIVYGELKVLSNA